MSRLLSTKDINFIKTLLENEPKKIEKIKIKDTSKDSRILDIISLSKKNNVEIIFEGIERIEAFFYPREMEDINYLENNILLKQSPLIVILDHIQDPQNLGSILRTSLGASVDAIIIPKDRACHLTPTVRKVSKAASEIIPVIVVSNLRNTVKMLQRNFIEIYACTGQADLSFFEVDFKGSKALIFGSEDKGIQKFLANEANEKIKIPIDSRLESLNVSNATSVILFEAKRQRN
ncbi:RNA methyltransferase [SAR86 cluster bacterium]|nr:RNA methyltransferase [SAR86 cluster bacterium]|tara:strand:- start:1162 stop:1863 length:702 start_codon:yes stop_codon:yes gene_type:complete